MDEPPGDGVAPLGGSGRVRSEPERQRRPRGTDGERVTAPGSDDRLDTIILIHKSNSING